jgi:hypothetical protein
VAYVVVAILSVFSCCVGFAVEIAQGNIGHIQNGRIPNARAALFPSIPFVPVAYVLVAWGLDQMHEGIGLGVVTAYGVFSIAAQWVRFRRARRKLEELKGIARKLEVEKQGSTG